MSKNSKTSILKHKLIGEINMRARLKPFSKLSISLFLISGLVACGGGSSNNNMEDEMDTGMDPMMDTMDPMTDPMDPADTNMDPMIPSTGNCVSFPRPSVGQKTKTLVKTLTTPTNEATVELTVTAISDTAISTSKTTTGDLTATGTSVNNFTSANNFIDTTEITSQDTTTITVPIVGDITTTTDTTVTFSPFSRAPIDEVCENQTWTDTYDLQTNVNVTSAGMTTSTSSVSNVSNIFTVESINESVTVDAGTFTTFKVKLEDGSIETTTWTDIATGIPVKSETKDGNGALVATQELLQ